MSRLSAAQRLAVFHQYGSWVREICDGCGRPIGSVGYTIANDPRTWCTAECREPALPAEWRHAHVTSKESRDIAPAPARKKIGRPTVNGHAMSAAERKRRQRELFPEMSRK